MLWKPDSGNYFLFYGTFVSGSNCDLLMGRLAVHSVSLSSYFLTPVGAFLMTDLTMFKDLVSGSALGTLGLKDKEG